MGSHSYAYRAVFLPPAGLKTNSRSPDGDVTVIAKFAFLEDKHRKLLENEWKIFAGLSDKSRRHLQQEWCGLNLVSGLRRPVPIVPVVPKFYGYYKPEMHEGATTDLSPILLMEDCGSPIQVEQLTPDEK